MRERERVRERERERERGRERARESTSRRAIAEPASMPIKEEGMLPIHVASRNCTSTHI
jgi:hypothetical protein